MKTPWRFLADLVSRKPAMAGDEVRNAGDVRAIELQPETEATGREIAQAISEPQSETIETQTADQTTFATSTLDSAADDQSAEKQGAEARDDAETAAGSVDRSDDRRAVIDNGREPLADEAETSSSNDGIANAISDHPPARDDIEATTVEGIVLAARRGTASVDHSRSKRRKPARKTFAAREAAGEADQTAVAKLSEKRNVFDEMAELDAEIDALRGLLAQKLIVQNAQLKALLQRYD